MTDLTSSELLQQIEPSSSKSLFEEIDDFLDKMPEDASPQDGLVTAPRGIHVLPS